MAYQLLKCMLSAEITVLNFAVRAGANKSQLGTAQIPILEAMRRNPFIWNGKCLKSIETRESDSPED